MGELCGGLIIVFTKMTKNCSQVLTIWVLYYYLSKEEDNPEFDQKGHNHISLSDKIVESRILH